MKVLTDAELMDCCEAYTNGQTLTALAEVYGVPPNRLSEILRENGVEIRPRGYPARNRARDEKIRKAFLFNHTPISELARKYGLSRQRVHQIAHDTDGYRNILYRQRLKEQNEYGPE